MLNKIIPVLATGFLSQAAHGLMPNVPEPYQVTSPIQDQHRVQHSEFTRKLGLQLQKELSGSPDQIARQLLSNAGLEGLELGSRGTSRNSAMRSRSHSFALTLQGTPLCEHHLKVTTFQSAQPFILGSLPPSLDFSYPPKHWPDMDKTFENIDTHIHSTHPSPQELEKGELNKCYIIRHSEVVAAWQWDLSMGGLSIRIIADDQEIYSFQPLTLHATIKTTIYSPNTDPDYRQKVETTIDNAIDDNNILQSTDFEISADGSYEEIDFESAIDATTSDDFATIVQTTAFTNAHLVRDWFKSYGFQDYVIDNSGRIIDTETANILLLVHGAGDNTNNALYTPSRGSDSAQITIGDGSGGILQNLGTDADVVSHEYGHHVIFKSLSSIGGETLVLHEGLADFFTFARFNDPCLGESICPSNGGNDINICTEIKYDSKEPLCLRTAKNSYQYGGVDLPPEPHLRSQFISGLMWDLLTEGGSSFSRDFTVELTLAALQLMAPDSGYRDFILALLKANRSINDDEAGSSSGSDAIEQRCETIYEIAEGRGLRSIINDFNCSSELPNIEGGGSLSSRVIASQSSDDDDDGFGLLSFCGIATGGEHRGSANWWGLFLFLAPLLWGLWAPQPAPQTQQSQGHKRRD